MLSYAHDKTLCGTCLALPHGAVTPVITETSWRPRDLGQAGASKRNKIRVPLTVEGLKCRRQQCCAGQRSRSATRKRERSWHIYLHTGSSAEAAGQQCESTLSKVTASVTQQLLPAAAAASRFQLLGPEKLYTHAARSELICFCL